jgi:hypothetical protein
MKVFLNVYCVYFLLQGTKLKLLFLDQVKYVM